MRRAIAIVLAVCLSSLLAGVASSEENPCQLDGDLIASAGLGDGLSGTGLGLGDGIGGTGLDLGGGTGHSDSGDGIGGSGFSSDGDGIGGTGILGTITRFGSICVNGLRVHYDDSTAVDLDGNTGDAADLAVGQVVWVEAAEHNGRLETEHIRVLSAASGIVTEVDLENRRFVLGDRVIEVPAGTPVLGSGGADETGLETLALGDRVLVSGLPAGDRIVASRVDRADGSGAGDFTAEEPWLERAASLGRLSLEGYLDATPGTSRFRLGHVDIDIDTSLLAPALEGIGSNTRVWLGGRLSKEGVLHVDQVSVRPTRLRGAGVPRDASRSRKRARKAHASDEAPGDSAQAPPPRTDPARIEPDRAVDLVDTAPIQPEIVSLESPSSQDLLRQLLAVEGLDDRRRAQLRDLIESGVISVANGTQWADSDQLETRLDELLDAGEAPSADAPDEQDEQGTGGAPDVAAADDGKAKGASKAERKRARRQRTKAAKRAKREKRSARVAALESEQRPARVAALESEQRPARVASGERRPREAKPRRPQRTQKRNAERVERLAVAPRQHTPGRLNRPERQKRLDRQERPARPRQLRRPDRIERPKRAERPKRVERPQRPDRIERPDRPRRLERPKRPDRPRRLERPKRPDRPRRLERPKRPERPERQERPKRPERVERPGR